MSDSRVTPPEADAVEVMYEHLDRLVKSLSLTGEPTLAVSVGAVASKSLLLAAASRFEAQLVEMMTHVAQAQSSDAIATFCVKQGVERRFHTLFDWTSSNVNKFVVAFGEDFKARVNAYRADNEGFRQAVGDFITLGAMRNELVHSDYVTFPLADTLDELVLKYRRAREFLPTVERMLLEGAGQ